MIKAIPKKILTNSCVQFQLKTIHVLSVAISLSLLFSKFVFSAQQDVDFNTDVLDVSDRSNIDLSHFAKAGYIMPGDYQMTLKINQIELPSTSVTFLPTEDDPQSSVPCLTPEIMQTLGMKEGDLKKITWWHNGECAVFSSVPGMTATGDLAQTTLYISIPQAYMEYSSETWDPPSRWDNGIPGLLFDYNLNFDRTTGQDEGDSNSISGTGTSGANLGAWRFRADWQYQHSDTTSNANNAALEWTRYYLYRALPSITSTLTLGQDTMNSKIFDNFQFMGANVATDDSMIPPNVRGYAPEVNGVANSNAKVTISQQGRVLYETQVPAGPFSIQTLNDSVSGKLDIKVEEQNGDVRTWQINTATIPYLSRPGSVRYSLSAGKPTDWNRNPEGDTFGSGEISIGITNGWSAYGGVLGSDAYQAVGVGLGRDLLIFGAISLDITQSRATLPDAEAKSGRSYRISYSKRFDDYDSQITFAGYRFSEKTYMSMTEYLDALNNDDSGDYSDGSNKAMYTITFNKQFRDLGLNLNLSYSQQTYWDHDPDQSWNLSLARYFDFYRWKNLNFSLNGYRNQNNGNDDKGIYASISIPFGETGMLGLNASGGDNRSQSVNWMDRNGTNDTWQVSAGASEGEASQSVFSGYFTHDGDVAQTSVSGTYQQGQYTTLGLSMTGGLTVTPHGAALHRTTIPGGTRLMVDTGGVSGIPVSANGAPVRSNWFGKAIIPDVNSYYRNTAQINVNDLNDNVEAVTSVVQDTLTAGAIGYRKFEVISGRKMMTVIKQQDGSAPPFGATVTKNGHQTGIVGDDGETWLAGIEPESQMIVSWDEGKQCQITFPTKLTTTHSTEPALLLPCKAINE